MLFTFQDGFVEESIFWEKVFFVEEKWRNFMAIHEYVYKVGFGGKCVESGNGWFWKGNRRRKGKNIVSFLE